MFQIALYNHICLKNNVSFYLCMGNGREKTLGIKDSVKGTFLHTKNTFALYYELVVL